MSTRRKRVTIKLSSEVHDRLRAVAKETGVSMSDLVRLAIHQLGRRGVQRIRRDRRTKRGSR